MTTKKLEREIKKIYQQSAKDIKKDWDKYMSNAAKRFEKREDEIKAAKKAGDYDEAKKLEKKLAKEKQSALLRDKQYKEMVDETARQITNANVAALAYVNGELPMFYQDAYNNELRVEAVNLGVDYTMADEATVLRRVSEGDIKLPYKQVNIAKDKRWNTKLINSQVTQGIVNGESMDEIADRIFPEIYEKADKGVTEQQKRKVYDECKNSAIRTARTLVNGAENAGRYDRYQELAKRGVVLKRVWIATGDSRTRDLHLAMDGQERDLDEPFVDPDGNDLMYPCDPSAPAETVYNCRCTTRARIIGFRKADGRIVETGVSGESPQHQKEIEREKERREEEKKEKRR